MKTASSIRTHKIEKIRTCLNVAHSLTCLRCYLQFNGNRSTLKWVCHFTLRYISLYTLKFIPTVRNMLWTKEMHHTLKFYALDNWKWATWKKSTRDLKGILIPTRYTCSRMGQFRLRGPSRIKNMIIIYPLSSMLFLLSYSPMSSLVVKIEF